MNDNTSSTKNINNTQIINYAQKSTTVAYVLLIFLGGLGFHRFYIGKVISGLIILVLSLMGMFVPFVSIIVGLWLLFDLFTFFVAVDKVNKKNKETALKEANSIISK